MWHAYSVIEAFSSDTSVNDILTLKVTCNKKKAVWIFCHQGGGISVSQMLSVVIRTKFIFGAVCLHLSWDCKYLVYMHHRIKHLFSEICMCSVLFKYTKSIREYFIMSSTIDNECGMAVLACLSTLFCSILCTTIPHGIKKVGCNLDPRSWFLIGRLNILWLIFALLLHFRLW